MVKAEGSGWTGQYCSFHDKNTYVQSSYSQFETIARLQLDS
jgi:hypothetical protein